MRFWCFSFLPWILWAQSGICQTLESVGGSHQGPFRLFRDLQIVEEVDQKVQEKLAPLLNYQLQAGYFTMPSARTFEAGLAGFGFSYVPPYHVWSLSFQFFNHLETSGNYWIYQELLDSVMGQRGFGNMAERAANLKWVLLRREDGIDFLPDLAIGWNDFLGTRRFFSFYTVATKQFLSWDLEATLGWGMGRIHGFFGGLGWSPWRKIGSFWKGLSFAIEYDANDYAAHANEHPSGKKVKTPFNVGIQYELADLFHFSLSTLRGEKMAASGALRYQLGSFSGFFPKTKNPAPYSAPIDTEPLGILRSRQELAAELAYALQEQGFDLYQLFLIPEREQKDRLWMKIVNVRYRQEEELRKRIERVLAFLAPSNLSSITVVIEADGIAVQQYEFRLCDLARYAQGQIGDCELSSLSSIQEASKKPAPYCSALLYQRKKRIWLLTFRPWFSSFLGSSRGKFKYEVGFSLNPEGYLFDELYYNLCGTYTASSSTGNIEHQDLLNPSWLLNVRTDSILYNQAGSFHLESAYLQKNWNLGKGWFSRVSFGYFESAYGGLSTEFLCYPVGACWAVGIEGAALVKRGYYGVGFERKIRKLTDKGPIFVPYVGAQYFLDLYYQYRPLQLDFKCSIGQFLARDVGARFEGGRTFDSGLRVGLWYTCTNANDRVNGKIYFDKGFSITMPLDFFLQKSSRTRVGYAMSAWLRDCGAISNNGKPLYPTLFWERYQGAGP